MATDDDAEPLNRLPWQLVSRSAVRLNNIAMILRASIFRLRRKRQGLISHLLSSNDSSSASSHGSHSPRGKLAFFLANLRVALEGALRLIYAAMWIVAPTTLGEPWRSLYAASTTP